MNYLILAIITSTLILIYFKFFERFGISLFQAITANYLSAALLGFINDAEPFSVSAITTSAWFPLSVIVGFTMIATFIVFGMSTQKAGLSVTAISSKMSVIIPVCSGFLFFGESPTLLKIAGIILALISFVLCQKKADARFDFKLIALPLLLFLGNGLNDTLLKKAQFTYLNGNDFITFLSTTFFFSMLLGLVILFTKERAAFSLKSIVAGIVLGILNWYSTYFFIVGLETMDVSVFIPVFNVSVVVASTLTGIIFFREKLVFLNILGIFVAIVSILLLAL